MDSDIEPEDIDDADDNIVLSEDEDAEAMDHWQNFMYIINQINQLHVLIQLLMFFFNLKRTECSILCIFAFLLASFCIQLANFFNPAEMKI